MVILSCWSTIFAFIMLESQDIGLKLGFKLQHTHLILALAEVRDIPQNDVLCVILRYSTTSCNFRSCRKERMCRLCYKCLTVGLSVHILCKTAFGLHLELHEQLHMQWHMQLQMQCFEITYLILIKVNHHQTKP